MLSTRYAISCVVNIYSAGVVIHDCRIVGMDSRKIALVHIRTGGGGPAYKNFKKGLKRNRGKNVALIGC
jgi:hypothetical protein